ncbi:MAG TPA: DUF1501 domain-containing protein [Rhizobacter sp.]|nr:DUF1501 domain-containing protein [Rhizobacter sp.]
MHPLTAPSRRRFLHQAAATGLVLAAPGLALARAATERRFVFILQRGAADGLDTVVPYADPAYARLRGALAIDPANATRLDGSFALHPALAEVGKLYAAQQALFVHAVASPYRERSHFDGQDVLESGAATPHGLKDGWLNRLVTLLPAPHAASGDAIAITPTIPLALRGPAAVSSHAPTSLPQAPEDFLQRVQQLYMQDAQLHAAWSAAMETRGMAATSGPRQTPRELGQLAAGFLAKPQGPRIAMLEMGGWDTHSAQAARLTRQLQGLDALVASLRDGLGEAWAHTVVLVATEFGRTAAANGTGGTDHGTGSVAMLLGGAVQGGRVLGDWPGLAPAALYQGRDLQPTTELHALMCAAAGECFGVEGGALARTLFPGQSAPKALPTLLRA